MTRGTSLRAKVPLYIGAGLLIVITAWTWVSFRNVRDAALTVGVDRLESATAQYADVYRTSTRDQGRSLRAGAGVPAVRTYLDQPGAKEREAASAALQRILSGTNRRIDVLRTDRTPLLGFPADGPLVALRDSLAPDIERALRGPEFSAVAPFVIVSDTIYSPLISAILKDSQPIAVVVLWRRAAPTAAENRNRFARVMGGNARLYIGNARGDIWLDNAAIPIRFPVVMPLDGTATRYVGSDTTEVIAAGRVVEGTPWALAITMSDSAFTAPARTFLERSIALGLFTLFLATTIAWLLSRRTTKPLHSLTMAAQSMAAGDYSQRVRIDRTDEIGILAESFNAMAAKVSDATAQLEDKVNERTAQLSARNEDLEAFAHSVSHDLRAPLRAMHGFSQALLEDCSAGMDETAKDYARRIAVASQRMDQLTQDLLTFSQVSRGEIAMGPVDLDLVLRDAIGQLEADISTKKARVDLRGPFPRVNAHRATLEQALANLVSNGLKFVAPGQPPQIHIRTEGTNGVVRVWVEDNGIGIDPVHHKRIFAVFERLHQSDKYAGTGIGLAIVRKAVERMGGTFGVESAPGSGSRFWIELQSAEAAQ